MKKIVLSFVIATLLLFGTVAAAEPAMEVSRLGVIDVNVVMRQSPPIIEFQRQLNEKGQALSNQLESEKANLSAEEFKMRQETVYEEFLKIKMDLEKQIDEKVKQAIMKVAKEKNLLIVFYKNSVAFGGMDVTQDVINYIE